MMPSPGFPLHWRGGAVAFRRSLILFWTLDGLLLSAFVAARALVYFDVLEAVPGMLSLNAEYTLPESFNYGKWALAALCLALAFLRSRVPLFGCLAVVFAMLLVDDALLIHETLGWDVARVLAIPPMLNLDPKQIGEIVVFGVMGLIALGLIAFGHVRSAAAYHAFAHRYLFVIVALAVVGVLGDALHHALWGVWSGTTRNVIDLVLTLIEDGGEMLLGSLAVAYSVGVVGIAGTGPQPAPAQSAASPAR